MLKKNIEPEHSNTFRNNINNLDDNKLRKELNLSILMDDAGPLALAKQGRAWTRHNAQLGIPIFSTDDARKWSVEDVASYVDQIVKSNNGTLTNKEQNSISQRFIDHVIIKFFLDS